MNKKEVERLSKIYLGRTILLLGENKNKPHTPYLSVEYSPESEGVDNDWRGEYESETNEIIIYSKNITSKRDLAKTIVHEYAHYLQSQSWMTRYYNMGHTYKTHPYEKEAFLTENLYWKQICK